MAWCGCGRNSNNSKIMDNKEYYYMNKTKVFKIDDERKLTEFIVNKNNELNS